MNELEKALRDKEALQDRVRELEAALEDIRGDLSEEYLIRARVYTGDEPLQAALAIALNRAKNALAKGK